MRRAVRALRPVSLHEEVDDELEHFRIFRDSRDVVEGRDVVRGVLRAVPREGLGDALDAFVRLVQAEVLRAQRLDGGKGGGHRRGWWVPAEVVVMWCVGVAAVLVADRRVDGLASFTLEPGWNAVDMDWIWARR